jgi:hypothetical protein
MVAVCTPPNGGSSFTVAVRLLTDSTSTIETAFVTFASGASLITGA